MLDQLSLTTVRAAAERIAPYVLRTPVIRQQLRADCELFLKAESLQSVGSFKIRGAFSLMTRLPEGTTGVATDSSGNHAQAVARAARVLGLRAVIVMPAGASACKRERAEADGAEIVIAPDDSEELVRRSTQIAHERQLIRVPPYDDPLVAAGQGTAALELVEEIDRLDRFYCPVSGGGLIAGCATVLAACSPRTEIIGVEPELADDTFRSLAAGQRVKIDPPRTIADGLRVQIPGELTWPVIQRLVHRVVLVSDDEMRKAIAWAAQRVRLVLEPSGAAALAAALREGSGRCGVLLSGGNVDPALFAEIMQG